MADTNETICDIIAEKRSEAKELRDTAKGVFWNRGELESRADDLEDEADRLDRARMKMENEMANLRKENAKMREALDESRRIASDLGGCRLNDYWKLNEIVRVCDAALATTSNQNTQEG